MDAETKALLKILSPLMKGEGFSKKGRTWYCELPETTEVLNLQMSRNWFFLNIGILIRALDEIALPKEYKCHIRARVHELMPNREKALTFFDFADKTMSQEERLKGVRAAVENYAIPFFRQCQTIEGIREAIKNMPQLGYGLSIRTRAYLGMVG